jgi:hypothetical protein
VKSTGRHPIPGGDFTRFNCREERRFLPPESAVPSAQNVPGYAPPSSSQFCPVMKPA